MFWGFQSGCCSVDSILSCYITYDHKFVNINFQLSCYLHLQGNWIWHTSNSHITLSQHMIYALPFLQVWLVTILTTIPYKSYIFLLPITLSSTWTKFTNLEDAGGIVPNHWNKFSILYSIITQKALIEVRNILLTDYQ